MGKRFNSLNNPQKPPLIPRLAGACPAPKLMQDRHLCTRNKYEKVFGEAEICGIIGA